MKRGKPLTADSETTRAWIERSKKPLKQSPLKKTNAVRLKKLREVQFGGEYAEVVRSEMCAIAKLSYVDPECHGMIQASHVISRGAGGRAWDMVPLCVRHHHEQHSGGFGYIAERYGITKDELRGVARRLWNAYQQDAA